MWNNNKVISPTNRNVTRFWTFLWQMTVVKKWKIEWMFVNNWILRCSMCYGEFYKFITFANFMCSYLCTCTKNTYFDWIVILDKIYRIRLSLQKNTTFKCICLISYKEFQKNGWIPQKRVIVQIPHISSYSIFSLIFIHVGHCHSSHFPNQSQLLAYQFRNSSEEYICGTNETRTNRSLINFFYLKIRQHKKITRKAMRSHQTKLFLTETFNLVVPLRKRTS